MSNLLVQNIKHTNNTTAQTIDTSGRTTVSIMNNDSTYRSDGGAVTQNLVQGLGKAWITLDGTYNFNKDSLNFSSINDENTGQYALTFTNNMGNSTILFKPTTKIMVVVGQTVSQRVGLI